MFPQSSKNKGRENERGGGGEEWSLQEMFHNEIESRVSQTSASPPADDGTARVAVSASLLVVI